MKVLVFLTAIALGAAFFSGCGGGGNSDSSLNMSGNGALSYSDMNFNGGQYVDLLSVTAKRDGYLVVEMNRAASGSLSDPAVRVVYGRCTTPDAYNTSFNEDGYLARDDDSGDGLNARAVFYVSRNQVFTVAFTSYASSDTGNYSWRIFESDSSAMVRSIDQDSTEKKLTVPVVPDGELIAE